jgi:hypothetical protein
MHLGGTKEQQLIFLNTHWGSRYTFTPPDTPAGVKVSSVQWNPDSSMSGEAPATWTVGR